MAPNLQIDHAKMRAVVQRMDTLIESLDSAGNTGSYAGLQEAAKVAQAVCSVAEPEMATFVQQYNVGFGAVADQYQRLCRTLVSIRNAVAQTANIHLANDTEQAGDFDPLKSDGLTVNDHHASVTNGNGTANGSGSATSSGGGGSSSTTTIAPGAPLQSGTRPASSTTTTAV